MDAAGEPFDALWARMHAPLCHFVCARVANAEDAEDILQDVFLRIYRTRETLRDPERLEGWMYQVARNRVIDHYRRPRPWMDLPETLASDEDQNEDGLEPLRFSLPEMVAGLPEPYRQALILADLEGIPQQDLARQSGVSLSGVKSRVQRARSKLKATLLNCFEIEFDLRGQVLDTRRQCCC
jgi:RNA polymerase sigma-70 factor, ECF subfamily